MPSPKFSKAAYQNPLKEISFNQKGSLLLESLLAIVIVAVSLTVIIQALLSNLRAMTRSSSCLSAMVSLENKMDALLYRCLRHEPIKENINSPGDELYQYALEERKLNGDEKTAVFKEVKLISSWKEGKKDQHISVVTYLLDFSNEK